MIDQLFMDDLAKDFVLPTEQPEEDTMLAAGPITSDVPQTGVRLGRAGVTPQQSAKAGGLDKPLIALLDTLAGAMRGATGAAIGLPGDIRSIVDLINQEGAEAVMGKRMFPTSEEVLQSNTLPQVVPAGAPNATERQKTVDIAQAVGEFLPAPGLLDVPKVVKGATKAVQATKGMPVGMSTQMVGEGVSELGFYSAAKEAVDSIQQPKGTGEQFLKQIEKTPGVKPEEIKWTGLDDFLKSKKSVTKAEVQEFLDKNRVEVKEVRLGEQETYDPARLKQLEEEYSNLKQHPIDDPSFGEEKYDEMIRLMNIRDRSTTDSLYRSQESAERAAQRAKAKGMPEAAERYFRQAELFNTRAEKLDLEGLGMDAPTKFSKYTLPGGENYREILITLPEKPSPFKTFVKSMGEKYGRDTPRNQWSPEDNSTYDSLLKGFSNEEEPFRSGHFDQPNILAHLRVNDRVDADGKKVLFVEEVQSDWHQAGRKKGYNTLEQRAANQKKLDALDAERKTLEAEKVRLEELAKPFTNQGKDAPDDILDKWNMTANRLNNLQREYAPIANQLATGSGVPDAPFKTTWHELSMKRAIQLAAEGGYDRVAFTTGKQQADRYSLSKQVKELTATHYGGERYRIDAVDMNGKPAIVKIVENENELDNLIGKEFARKIVDETKGKTGSKTYSGLELDVGGEGMKGFYDQILPKFLDKYAKKWDAKTGMTKIQIESKAQAMADADLLEELGTPRNKINTSGMVSVQYIDVTPKMKESVLTKGQPLFAIGAGGAAVQQEDNQ